MKNNVKNSIIVSIIILMLSMACQLNIGGPKPPEATIPVSQDAAVQAEEIIESAVNNRSDMGSVSFTLSEEQVTSYLTTEISSRPEPTIHDPQVYLRDGKIDIFGELETNSVTANAHLTLSASIDENGNPKLTIESVDLGPIPAPSFLLEQISALVDEAVTGSLSSAATGFRAESIVIADGLITITGTMP